MIWSRLNVAASKRRFQDLSASNAFTPSELTTEYRLLRESLLLAVRKFDGKEDHKSAYDIDTGLALYSVLGRLGFDVRNASDDGVWRHLSLNVLPDRVEQRWTHRPEDRFWRSRSRIWLRAVWWLIHLAWQGSEDATRAALDGISTDMVVQIIERPGRHGFRVELARALFKERSVHISSQNEFRALVKLNTARLVVVEPTLYEGGVQGYAASLYFAVAKLENTTSTMKKKANGST